MTAHPVRHQLSGVNQKMLQTYKATLRGNHLLWGGDAPPDAENLAVEVYVTILTENLKDKIAQGQGKEMAAALEKLAASNAFADISDPVAWQREERLDGQLPGRDT
jgi:hypothetical protein